jgi:hypothetical protein
MFNTLTPNLGQADLVLGRSAMNNPNFQYSTCHHHYHFLGYADYFLYAQDGTQVALGHKQSFCVQDTQIYSSIAQVFAPYYHNCGQGMLQGISVGWADDYFPDLPCQWIDVTDLPAGNYTLRVAINPEHRFAESSYTDNEAEVPVTVPADWTTENPLAPCKAQGPDRGIGRNCGWTLEGSHGCTPGDRISVGCSTFCGLGSCVGSWDLRICDGDQPCNGGDLSHVLQQDFGECSTGVFNLDSTCPVATFTCPASGRYTVLKAPDIVGDTDSTSCALATRIVPAAGDAGAGFSDGGTPTDASPGH